MFNRLVEISQEEADLAMTKPIAAEWVLLSLQKQLKAAGITPYRTNVHANVRIGSKAEGRGGQQSAKYEH
jgi:hypothetical protein